MKRFASDHHHTLQHEGGFISRFAVPCYLNAADDIQVSTSPSSKFSTVKRCFMFVQYSEDIESVGLRYIVWFKSEKTGLHSQVSAVLALEVLDDSG